MHSPLNSHILSQCKQQPQTPSFPNKREVEDGGGEGEAGAEARVEGEGPCAEVVVAGEGVQQVLVYHHLVLLPPLLILAVAVLVDVVAQPPQTLQKVDVGHVLLEGREQLRLGAHPQLHQKRQQVTQVSQQDHRLEDCHELVHLAEPPLPAQAHVFLKDHEQPVAAQQSPQLPHLRAQLLHRFQIRREVVGPGEFEEGGEEAEELSGCGVTLSEEKVPSLMRPQMAWWRSTSSFTIGRVSRKVRGSSPKKVSAWVVVSSFSSGIGFSICSC